jgi:hypothetical protein
MTFVVIVPHMDPTHIPIMPQRALDSVINGVFIILIDLTENKKLDADLRQHVRDSDQRVGGT